MRCQCLCFDQKVEVLAKIHQGDDIKQHFDDKEVRDCDSWKGCMDEVNFHVYAMKEPDYVMSLMSTYGINLQTGKKHNGNG